MICCCLLSARNTCLLLITMHTVSGCDRMGRPIQIGFLEFRCRQEFILFIFWQSENTLLVCLMKVLLFLYFVQRVNLLLNYCCLICYLIERVLFLFTFNGIRCRIVIIRSKHFTWPRIYRRRIDVT